MGSRTLVDSNIGWAGFIPNNWETISSKYLFYESKERKHPGDVRMTSSVKYGIIPQDEYRKLENFNVINATKDLENWKHVDPYDFVISLMSFNSGIEMSEVSGCVTWHYIVIKSSKPIHPQYYKWMFKCPLYITALSKTSNFIRNGQDLRFSNFSKVPLLIPPINEQIVIASFLDRKCTEISALSADIQSQIDILDSYKKSMITHVVTKGLNPNAEYKSINARWMPQIPKHWEISKFKYHLKRSTTKNPGNEIVLSLYREFGIVKKEGRTDNHNVTSDDTSKYLYVLPNDFVINKMKAWQGSVAVSALRGIVSPAYYVYKFTSDNIDKKYFHYLMRNKAYSTEFRRLSGGIREGQWDLPASSLENILILIPPLSEQQEIVAYLDSMCADIDITIQRKIDELEILEKYKKSLIYEYVTGKKEVKYETK